MKPFRYPYAITSDQHAHAFSAFATVGVDGVNSRLQATLDEIARSYRLLNACKGNRMYLAGDLFHERGMIKPSVFNPTHQTFTDAHTAFPEIITLALPGNHDLEGRDTTFLGNAMQALSSIDRFTVALEPTVDGDVVMFPWYAKLDELREAMARYASANRDAIIHAPINDVLTGIPPHGFDAAELAAIGFRRVFAGHYHNHKVMADGKVISIGAMAHQTWSDPGTVAGYLIVYEDRIEHVPTQAPLFVDVDLDVIADEQDLVDLVSGHYARLKLGQATTAEVAQWRADLAAAGALGNIVLGAKVNAATTRVQTGDGKSQVSLGASVEAFVRANLKSMFPEEVSKAAQEVLSEVTQ